MKRIKMPLLARIIIAILLGVIFGNFFNEVAVRAFLTFNGIFSQFLGFMIPLIIIGLVTPAIADIGHGAGNSSLPLWASPLPTPSWRVFLPMAQARHSFLT